MEIAAKKAAHRERLASISRTAPEISAAGKYWYLEKKDWDEKVIEDVNTPTAADYRKFDSFKLSDLAENSTTLKFTEADFDDTQINFKKARRVVRKLLDVPSKIEYKEQIEKIKDDYWKGQWKHFYKDSKKLVETETMIHNYASVVEIGWQPEDNSKPLKLKDNQLKGHYVLKVKMSNTGEFLDVVPASDWVEANFSKKALATAQKAFFSYYEKVAIKPNKDQKKIVYETGFVDVESEGLFVVLEKDHINKLKYIHPKKIKVGPMYVIEKYEKNRAGKSIPVVKRGGDGRKILAKRKDKVIEERWIGYCKDSNKTIPLTSEFVHANFTSNYLDQVKHLSKSKSV